MIKVRCGTAFYELRRKMMPFSDAVYSRPCAEWRSHGPFIELAEFGPYEDLIHFLERRENT